MERLDPPREEVPPLSRIVTESVLQVQDPGTLPQPRSSSEASGVLRHVPRPKAISMSDEPNLEVSDEEARVDTLATGAFSDDTETDIGHFGIVSTEIQVGTLLLSHY